MNDPQPTVEALRDEAGRARHVRFIVDFTSQVIMQNQPQRSEAEELVGAARQQILQLFPGREETYELIYASRFRRLIDEFSRADEPRRGVVLPFLFRRQPSA